LEEKAKGYNSKYTAKLEQGKLNISIENICCDEYGKNLETGYGQAGSSRIGTFTYPYRI
jgi:hypothetical protein